MKLGIQPMQLFSGACGMMVIAILHLATPLNFTGYGPDGLDWLTLVFSGFWFGIVGNGGGMLIYWLVRRRIARSQPTQNSN